MACGLLDATPQSSMYRLSKSLHRIELWHLIPSLWFFMEASFLNLLRSFGCQMIDWSSTKQSVKLDHVSFSWQTHNRMTFESTFHSSIGFGSPSEDTFGYQTCNRTQLLLGLHTLVAKHVTKLPPELSYFNSSSSQLLTLVVKPLTKGQPKSALSQLLSKSMIFNCWMHDRRSLSLT